MGGVLNACKSTISSKSTPETINENHLETDDKAYQHQRKFEDEFLKNTEDLIQEITTNSNWQHHETRYLLSQFRRLGEAKDTTNLTIPQFTQFLPVLLETFINIKGIEQRQFQSNKTYAKWLKHFIKLFSNGHDQISFQSFANLLSTACRGDTMERAELLFNIFDVDGDGVFNQNELHLFLYFIFNIDCNPSSNDDDANTTNNDHNKPTPSNPTDDDDTPKSFDISKIILRAQFIDYIQDLIRPKQDNKTVDDHKTATNGMDSTTANANTKGETQTQTNDETIDSEPPPTTTTTKEAIKEEVDTLWAPSEEDIAKDKESPTSSSSKEDKSSTNKGDAEWEKIPLKKVKNNSDNNNESTPNEVEEDIDFLANMSLQDLKSADNETLSNTLQKLLKDKLYRKHKLKREAFIAFASKSIAFDHLFESFMIIPTRDDECKIITDLMRDTEMKLGASWFVLSKEWWDKWAVYTGYNAQQDTDTNERKDEKDNDDEEDDTIIDATNAAQRAMRPIKISNRDLLDEDSYYTVLRKDLQENNQFILLPKGAWEQLHEWYGGGPSIERFVVCTDKTVRMKEIQYTLDKLRYEYKEQERLDREAMKRKKSKQRNAYNNRGTMDDDRGSGMDSDGEKNGKTKGKNGAFDVEQFNKEYPLFLQELSMTVNSETLRIDLHPIYCTFVVIDDKGHMPSHADREIMISRYASLPELYIGICARSGYQINDIEEEKKNYLLYLEGRRETKANERSKGSKDKKNKSKKKDKNTTKIALPPRMWSTRNVRGGPTTDRLLYPIPKFIVSATDKDKEKEKETEDVVKEKDTEKGDKETETETQTETGDKEEDETTNDKTKDDEQEETEEEEDLDDDDIDLQTIGLQSGISIALEFAHPNKKKGNALCYGLNCPEEDAVCEPEIDDGWLEFETGDYIDVRDRWGKWYEAIIKYHKPANAESMPRKSPPVSKVQQKEIETLKKLEAIHIHYTAWEDKWNEWIFIDPAVQICKCRTVCNTEKTKHRIAAHKTQSKFKADGRSVGRHNSGRYSGRSSGRYSNRGDNYGWSSGRGRESIRGTPSTAGCVGLVNLGNTCFMNSILQCVSNTPHLRTFFTSGQYKPDINRTNPLGMKGELANEFAKLVSDVWSGNYKVIAPRSLKHKLSKFAPQFSGWQQHDSQEFLAFLLDGLHEDLNLVRTKPYTEKIESQGRKDNTVADLSWKIYLKRNKSKIVDLFQAQQKSHVICPDCNRNSITFDTYMYLSVPIVGHSSKSLVVDVFHRKNTGPVNKPTRHIFHVNKYQKVRDLAKMVAKRYDTKSQFVLFYENWNMKVAREYDHNIMLGMVPDREALGCYILKDWNEEVTPQEIKKKDLSLQIAKVCHSAPLQSKSRGNKLSSSSGPLFGMPFVISFLNVHTRRQVHQVIYQKLFMWVGPDVLKEPPSIVKLKRIPKKKKEKETEKDSEDKPTGSKKEEEEIEYEYVKPSREEIAKYEAEWDEILKTMPYKLRLMPYRHYSFYSSKAPEEIPCDDVVFVSKIRNDKDIDIIIEWGAEPYANIKSVVNKVVVDADYSQWKKEKQKRSQAGGHNEALSLYDCINSYVAQETLGENDLWYCSECKKHERANKKLDLWSFPEILIIHLKRFQVLSVGRFGRGEKISTFVDCPIRGLDLTPYVINGENETAPIYDLYAVSSHSGSCGGGHYTAYALNAETDRWYYFNDSSVRPAKESDIVSQSTYVLFYKKCH